MSTVRVRFRNTARQKNKRAYGAYYTFHREFSEFLRLARQQYADKSFKLPIAHCFGFVQTNEGLGAIFEKINGEGDRLAPSLQSLFESNSFHSVHEDALHALKMKCKSSQIVLGDTGLKDIVFSETRSGIPECVCVDGFGERTLIPVHRWFKSANDAKLDRVFNRMWQVIKTARETSQGG